MTSSSSSTSVPKSDVDVPGRNSLRNSFRNSSFGRADSFDEYDSVPADEIISRSDDDDVGNSSRRLSAALAAEREETRIRLSKELENENENESEEDPQEEPLDEEHEEGTTMSLMDLLEETDRKAGVEGPTYRFDEVGGEPETEEEEEEEEEVEVKGGGKEVACSVCKVKHKGEALVACGHAYCRMCSREMWVQKGFCPLCSSFVLEILDIF